MDRRSFLQNIAVSALATEAIESLAAAPQPQDAGASSGTLLAEFDGWKVHEDLATRDGAITFTGPRNQKRVLTKSAEPCFATADPPYLGLKMADIGTSG